MIIEVFLDAKNIQKYLDKNYLKNDVNLVIILWFCVEKL